jgi:hypothetical protein
MFSNLTKIDLIYGGFGQDGTITSQLLSKFNHPHILIGRGEHQCVTGSKDYNCVFGEKCSLIEHGFPEMLAYFPSEFVRDIYFFAAHHSSSERRLKTVSDAVDSFNINYHLFNRIILDSILGGSVRSIFYANTSKIFEGSKNVLNSERSQSSPITAYAHSKALVRELISDVKSRTDIRLFNGILFNHESAFRKRDFFSSKVIGQALQITRGERDRIEVNTLQGSVDMGLAVDFCGTIIYLQNSNEESGDYIFSTGFALSLRTFVELVLEKLGIPQSLVIETGSAGKCERPLVGDNRKIRSTIGLRVRTPEEMVSSLILEYQSSDKSRVSEE